ncbi:MAG: TonB-dependent receptor [bacterium]|nr:TonB-dependent receptor [bacterium]
MKKIIQNIGFIAFLVFTAITITNTTSYSQTTGSINGTVIDSKDKLPLVGAVVQIVGSSKGSITDGNGEYIIINVDVGNYDVEASYIGYTNQKQTGVRVSVDTKTRVNFEMSTGGEITTGVIEIQAERKGIDVEQSGRLVGQEQIENTGIRGIQNIASTTAGVVTDERGTNINIRGGRTSTNSIIVDGVSTTNPVDGTSTAFVPNSLLQELAVLTGGFGAEYGNALDGVINVTTKSGSDRYTGSVEGITDAVSGNWIDTKSQQYNLYNVSFGGPLIPSKGISNVINFYGGVERQFLGVTNPSWIADKIFADGIIPNYNTQLWSYSGRLNFDFSQIKKSKIPVQLKLGYLRTDKNARNFIQSWALTNSGRAPLNVVEDQQIYARISHTVSNKFFYELQANYYKNKNITQDAFFKDDWFAYGDTLRNPGISSQGTRLEADPNFANVFFKDGRIFNQFDSKELEYIGGKLDASYSILSKKYGDHDFKFGGEYRYHTLKKVLFNPMVVAANAIVGLDSVSGQPIYQVNPRDLWFGRSVLLNSYGVDIRDQFGNQIVSGEDIEAKHPVVGAFYIRDKVDFNDFTVNAGLRMDYLDVKTDILKDPKVLLGANGELLSSDVYEPSKGKVFFSPRLGFSFPVTDKTVFVAQFGKFIQMPPLDFLYINKLAFQFFFANSVQNVAENSALGPEKLTSYEFGFKQEIGDYLNLGLTAYYKETKDQIGVTRINGSATVPSGYALYANTDFSISRGLDFYMSMRRVNRLAVDIAYTLLFASGIGSDPNTKFQLANNPNAELPKFAFPQDYDQRHTGNINLDYRYGSSDVPKGFWGGVLSNLGFNALFSFNSGRPYTIRQLPIGQFVDDGLVKSTKNQVYTDWNLRLDAKLDKTVKILKTNLNFYVYILNLFNSELINRVYGATGRPDDNGYLSTPTGAVANQLFRDNFRIRVANITNWGTPRQVRFGIKLSF